MAKIEKVNGKKQELDAEHEQFMESINTDTEKRKLLRRRARRGAKRVLKEMQP